MTSAHTNLPPITGRWKILLSVIASCDLLPSDTCRWVFKQNLPSSTQVATAQFTTCLLGGGLGGASKRRGYQTLSTYPCLPPVRPYAQQSTAPQSLGASGFESG